MVTFQKVLRYISAEPFRPFRIRVDGGRTFDITEPDAVRVGVTRLFISPYYNEDEDPHEYQFLLSSIEAIESLEAGSAAQADERARSDDSEGQLQMMTRVIVREYVRAQPFRPFRIRMASGQVYEVRHPEMISIGRTSVRVFPATQPEPVPDWHDCSLLLMETLEPINASQTT